jgi:hypothetical protein
MIHRLTPFTPRNGLATILANWKEPVEEVLEIQTSWLPSFSSGVTPVPIHSHNDYTRDVPLFRALSVGCLGVEADIHLVNSSLAVGHTAFDLRLARTLASLYLDPLMNILQSQNRDLHRADSPATSIGVFNDKPQVSIVLLLDFKTPAEQILELLMTQLQPFRDAGFLTRWNGTAVIQAPLTIVGSGLMSTRLDLLDRTNGAIFLDAPLDHLSDVYNSSNSLYASARLEPAVGSKIGLWGMNKGQRARAAGLIAAAQAKGLQARFWDTPSWPVGRRDKVWKQLEEVGVGMLNADDIRTAALVNWNWCSVAWVHLC